MNEQASLDFEARTTASTDQVCFGLVRHGLADFAQGKSKAGDQYGLRNQSLNTSTVRGGATGNRNEGI